METLVIIGVLLTLVAVCLLLELARSVRNIIVVLLIIFLFLLLQILKLVAWALRLPKPSPPGIA